MALSCALDVTILDAESLEIKSDWPSSSNGITVQYAWFTSIAHTNLQRPFAVVLYSGALSVTHLRILAFDEAESISQVKDESIELSFEVNSQLLPYTGTYRFSMTENNKCILQSFRLLEHPQYAFVVESSQIRHNHSFFSN